MKWILTPLALLTFVPIYLISMCFTFSPISPIPYNLLFDVAHSSFTDFNFTATTNNDGTNNFHYRYNLILNITVRKLDNNYDFLHYDDVTVMAFYKNKRFAMVDLTSFHRGKDLSNTTDVLSLTHSLIGEYDVLVIDPPPVDSLNASNGLRGVDAITHDHMDAQLYYSISPPSNVTGWMHRTIYSKEELEFKCELELKFPLLQHSNASTLKTINCNPTVLAYSWKYYLYIFLVVPLYVLISLSVVAFIMWLSGVEPAYDPCKIHDSVLRKNS